METLANEKWGAKSKVLTKFPNERSKPSLSESTYVDTNSEPYENSI